MSGHLDMTRELTLEELCECDCSACAIEAFMFQRFKARKAAGKPAGGAIDSLQGIAAVAGRLFAQVAHHTTPPPNMDMLQIEMAVTTAANFAQQMKELQAGQSVGDGNAPTTNTPQ